MLVLYANYYVLLSLFWHILLKTRIVYTVLSSVAVSWRVNNAALSGIITTLQHSLPPASRLYMLIFTRTRGKLLFNLFSYNNNRNNNLICIATECQRLQRRCVQNSLSQRKFFLGSFESRKVLADSVRRLWGLVCHTSDLQWSTLCATFEVCCSTIHIQLPISLP